MADSNRPIKKLLLYTELVDSPEKQEAMLKALRGLRRDYQHIYGTLIGYLVCCGERGFFVAWSKRVGITPPAVRYRVMRGLEVLRVAIGLTKNELDVLIRPKEL